MSISAITSITNAATTLGNLILVTPQNVLGYQPQNPAGSGAAYTAPAILFNYEGEQSSTLESDITDHYVEDNTAVQDQIALKPIMITTQGFIGELNDIPPNEYFAGAALAAQKLTIISSYTPGLSATALLAYNEALLAYQTAANVYNNAVSTWSTINKTGGTSVISGNGISSQANQTQQQMYYQQFYGYWNSRTLFTVQTPWAIFTDMAIMRLRAVQSAETNVISDFEITFKQIRYAKVLADTSLNITNPDETQGRLQSLASTEVNLGTSALTTSTTTFAGGLNSIS